MLAGFGPYVAVYLAEQQWTQENIGFVLTASGLAGLLALMPGGELLDTVRSKRALAALGASMVAVTALAIGIWPDFPVVFTALVLHGTTGAFLGPAIAAISLGVVGHLALPEQLGRNQRFAFRRIADRDRAHGPDWIFDDVPSDVPDRCRAWPPTVRCTRCDSSSRH